MKHVFTYGSLMFSEVWENIVHGRHQSVPATLSGYRRFSVHGEAWPVVMPGIPQDRLDGCLYRNVSVEDIRLLDEFEGDYYFRTPLQVKREDRIETAEVYVLRPRFYSIATQSSWDPVEFERSALNRFRAEYRGFR